MGSIKAYEKIGDVWKTGAIDKVKVGDSWKTVEKAYCKIDGVWKQIGDSIPRDGLLAEYLFANNCNDTSGNSINGTANAITYGTGKVGSCAIFNGSSSYFTINNDLATMKSISLWINPTAANNGCFAAIAHTSGHYAVFSLWYDTSGRVQANVRGYAVRRDTPPMSMNTWHHIVVTNSSITASTATDLKIYVDGSQVNLTAEASSTAYTAGTGRSAFGGFFNNRNYPERLFYKGSICAMRMYNRILTAAEVTQLYNE